MPADLHIHTCFSDGSDTPGQIVDQALALGLDAIAVTDHDTVAGIVSAQEAVRDRPLTVVPGVEINTEIDGRQVHILGYYIDISSPALVKRLELLAEARDARVKEMIRKLQHLNIPISVDDVRPEGGGTLGRPHIAAVLWRIGTVSSVQEAFERFIGRNRPAYVSRSGCTPVEAVELVLEAGGVPVMAHPGTAEADEIIPALVEKGLKGLEVFHPEHDRAQVKHYLNLSRRYGLLSTGGSDYHGRGYRSRLGQATVPASTVDELRALRG